MNATQLKRAKRETDRRSEWLDRANSSRNVRNAYDPETGGVRSVLKKWPKPTRAGGRNGDVRVLNFPVQIERGL